MTTTPPLISLLNPTTQVQGAGAGSAPQGATASPPALAGLPSGTFVSGFVINRDRSGNPVLRTDKGDVTLRSELFLKTGSEIVIKLERTVHDVKARIVSVDGESYATALSKADVPDKADMILKSSLLGQSDSDTAVKDSISLSTSGKSDSVSLKEGTVRAVLVSTTPLNNEQLAELNRLGIRLQGNGLPSGTHIMLKVVSSDTSQATLFQNQSLAAHSLLPEALTNTTQQPSAASPSAAQFYAAYQKQQPAQTIMGALPPAPSLPTAPTNVNLPLMATEPLPPLPTATASTTPPTVSTALSPSAPLSPSPLPAAGNIPITAPLPPALSPAAATSPAVALPAAPAPITLPTPAAIPTTPVVAAEGIQTTTTTQITATPPPLTAAAPPTPLFTTGNQMQAVVVGTEFSGEVVLHTPIGTVKLPMDNALPTGTKLVVELLHIEPPSPTSGSSAAASLLTADDASIAELAKSWPALSDLIKTLAVQDPAAASLLIQKSIPQIGRNFTANLLFFISALKGGDVRDWLGKDAVNKLEQSGNGELLRKVSGEFTTLRNAFMGTADNSNWQPLFFPLAQGNDLQQARLYYKRDGQKDKSGKTSGNAGTRFILEVGFSELGQMQLDGFVKQKDKTTFFDLIIRTLKSFSSEMQQDITGIFNNASELTGFKGSVQIQHSREFPINPAESLPTSSRNTIVA